MTDPAAENTAGPSTHGTSSASAKYWVVGGEDQRRRDQRNGDREQGGRSRPPADANLRLRHGHPDRVTPCGQPAGRALRRPLRNLPVPRTGTYAPTGDF